MTAQTVTSSKTAESKPFTKCRGKLYCRDNGEQCLSCGRSFEEIAATRDLIEKMARTAQDLNHEDPEAFLFYVMEKSLKKVLADRGQDPNMAMELLGLA